MNNRRRTEGRIYKFVKMAINGLVKRFYPTSGYQAIDKKAKKATPKVVGFVNYKLCDAWQRHHKADVERWQQRTHQDVKYKAFERVINVGGVPVAQ